MRLVRTAAATVAVLAGWTGSALAQTVVQPQAPTATTAPIGTPTTPPAGSGAAAQKAPPASQPAARAAPPPRVVTKPVPYCWHATGWNGPGWYRCGAAWSQGQGWGGAAGWNAWPVPVANTPPPPRRRIVVATPPAPVVVQPSPDLVRDVGRFSPPAY